jgi:alpha-methylacyl-CoA racemase
MAVGAIEARFFKQFVKLLKLPTWFIVSQYDREKWPQMRDIIQKRFLTASRDSWTRLFSGTDACVTPVLGIDELMRHPHNEARRILRRKMEPAPAPRLGRTPAM